MKIFNNEKIKKIKEYDKKKYYLLIEMKNYKQFFKV